MSSSESIPKKPRYGPASTDGFLKAFQNRYSIRDFDVTGLSLAKPGTNFNDCLNIPHYEGNDNTIAGKQRRGIAQSIGEVENYHEHVEKAAVMPYPLGLTTPLPEDLNDALTLIAYSTPNEMRTLWGQKLGEIQNLARQTRPISTEWLEGGCHA